MQVASPSPERRVLVAEMIAALLHPAHYLSLAEESGQPGITGGAPCMMVRIAIPAAIVPADSVSSPARLSHISNSATPFDLGRWHPLHIALGLVHHTDVSRCQAE
jgi:hypothetical protein